MENLKYAVLNSSEENITLSTEGHHRKPTAAVDFWVPAHSRDMPLSMALGKGKPERGAKLVFPHSEAYGTMAEVCIMFALLGVKSPAVECGKNTLHSPPRI